MLGIRVFPGGSEDKASACNARDPGSIPGLGLEKEMQENPMDRGAWQAIVHGVAELDTTEGLHFTCMKCSLGISNFLEEISSLSCSIVFLYFFALITVEGFLISPCYSLELCIQMLLSFLFSFAFHFSSFHSYL